MSRKFFCIPQLWMINIARVVGLKIIINQIIIFAGDFSDFS